MKKTLALMLLAAAATPAAAADFHGFHIGATAGLDRAAYDNVALGIDRSFGGFVYGVSIGYDAKVSNAVTLGLEATLDDSTADWELTNGNNFAEIDAGRDYGLVARIGVKASDNVLVYGLAGYANGRIKGLARTNGVEQTGGADADGFRIGAGVEMALGSGFYTKAEYRYTDYEAGFTRNQAVIGAGFRF